MLFMYFFFFKQKTAYEMRISDWSSDVCSSDLAACAVGPDYVAPVPPAASSGPFIAADTPAVSTDPVAENWWRLYDDPVLDGLVEDALTANTDLRVAIANIARADRKSTRLNSSH